MLKSTGTDTELGYSVLRNRCLNLLHLFDRLEATTNKRINLGWGTEESDARYGKGRGEDGC